MSHAATTMAWSFPSATAGPTFAFTDRPLALGQISLHDSWTPPALTGRGKRMRVVYGMGVDIEVMLMKFGL